MARRGENIYKRKDGRYEGRYIKGRNISGKPVFGYVYARSYAETKQILTLAKASSERRENVQIVGNGTLADFLSVWLNSTIRERVKLSTYAQYHARIHQYILPALGRIPVSRLTKEQVLAFIRELQVRSLAASTIRNIMGVLCLAMKYAADSRLTIANPCDRLALPQPDVSERRALERTEQVKLEQLLTYADSSVALGVLLSLYTGLRIGEICALRWDDVDLAARTLTVRSTLQRIQSFGDYRSKTVLVTGSPKSKRSFRCIPLPAGLTDRLRSCAKEGYVLSGSETPVEPRTLRARFAKLREKIGLNVPFHTLRHTYATRCLEYNFDIQTVAELLGHSTANTTMKIYAHSVSEHKRMLTERIQFLSEIDKPSNKPSKASVLL
jgi:integrase